MIAALPAVDVLWNCVAPEEAPLALTTLLVMVALAAVEALRWLFTMPTPAKEKEFPFVWVVKALAPELNVMESMVTVPERVRKVTVEVLNVAVSPALTGGIAGVQLPPVF